jgi:hypothetical protein
VAAQAAYSGAYAVGAVVVSLGILATIADRVVGAHRITELDNTRARLRQLPLGRKRRRNG